MIESIWHSFDAILNLTQLLGLSSQVAMQFINGAFQDSEMVDEKMRQITLLLNEMGATHPVV
jgi:hypothetical protein